VLGGLALGALLLAGAGPVAGPAVAATTDVHEVRLTGQGPVPVHVQAAPGETLRFVNADDFVHRVVGDTVGWRFDTGTLVPGQSATVPTALPGPGTYGFRGTGLDAFIGTVTVPASSSASPGSSSSASSGEGSPSASASAGAGASAAGTVSPSATASRSASASASVSASASASAPAGTTGSTSPSPRVTARPPSGAELPGVVRRPAPPGAELPGLLAARSTPAADVDALRSPVPARPYGLPLAVAVVLLLGVVWLLVRTLLAEPLPGAGRDEAHSDGHPSG
jgi:plastocyanin